MRGVVVWFGHFLVTMAVAVTVPSQLLAHSGGLDANGCHHDRKRGGYHCHQPRRVIPLAPTLENYNGQLLVKPAAEPRVTPKLQVPSTWNTVTTGTGSEDTPSAEKVIAVQLLLRHLKFDPGATDGKFGQKTKEAIEQFQAIRLLPVSGKIDDTLLAELARAVAAFAPAP